MARLLLLEYDAGYAGTAESMSKKHLVENKISSETELSVNGVPTTIFAVLQKYGVKNENGRVYSEEILKREAKRYLEECKPPRKHTDKPFERRRVCNRPLVGWYYHDGKDKTKSFQRIY